MIFIATSLAFTASILFLSLGYIFRKKSLKGSCGGLSQLLANLDNNKKDKDESCPFCGSTSNKCETPPPSLSLSPKSIPKE